MKQLITALRKLKRHGWPFYVISHIDVLQKVRPIIGPRVNRHGCLECGGKIQKVSPTFYKHTKSCPGRVRSNAFFEVMKEYEI